MTKVAKKIVITGANGFIGRHLTAHLLSLDYIVYGTTTSLTKPGLLSHPNLYWVEWRDI